MKRVYLDFKFSLFGDFKTIQDDIQAFSVALGPSFSKRMDNQLTGTQITPIYIYDCENYTIVVSSGRIDIIIKHGKDNDLEPLIFLLEKARAFFSSFSRIAINSTFFVDGIDTDAFKNNLSKTPNSNIFPETKELYIRENFVSKENDLVFNNIVSFGTDEIINRETFAKLNTILFSIDINNSPVSSDLNYINLNNVQSYFYYMISNYKTLLSFLDKFALEAKNNAVN